MGVMAVHLRSQLLVNYRQLPMLLWLFFSATIFLFLGLVQADVGATDSPLNRPFLGMFFVGFLGGISAGPLSIGAGPSRETVGVPTLPISPRARAATESLSFLVVLGLGVLLMRQAGLMVDANFEVESFHKQLTMWWPGTWESLGWMACAFAGFFSGHLRLHTSHGEKVFVGDMIALSLLTLSFGFLLSGAWAALIFAAGTLAFAWALDDRALIRPRTFSGAIGGLSRSALGGAAQLRADLRGWVLPGLARGLGMCVMMTAWFMVVSLLMGDNLELDATSMASVVFWPYLLLLVLLAMPLGVSRYSPDLSRVRFARAWVALPVPRGALARSFALYGLIAVGIAVLVALALAGAGESLALPALRRMSLVTAIALTVTAPLSVPFFTADTAVSDRYGDVWMPVFMGGYILFKGSLFWWLGEGPLAPLGAAAGLGVMLAATARAAVALREWLK